MLTQCWKFSWYDGRRRQEREHVWNSPPRHVQGALMFHTASWGCHSFITLSFTAFTRQKLLRTVSICTWSYFWVIVTYRLTFHPFLKKKKFWRYNCNFPLLQMFFCLPKLWWPFVFSEIILEHYVLFLLSWHRSLSKP